MPGKKSDEFRVFSIFFDLWTLVKKCWIEFFKNSILQHTILSQKYIFYGPSINFYSSFKNSIFFFKFKHPIINSLNIFNCLNFFVGGTLFQPLVKISYFYFTFKNVYTQSKFSKSQKRKISRFLRFFGVSGCNHFSFNFIEKLFKRRTVCLKQFIRKKYAVCKIIGAAFWQNQ